MLAIGAVFGSILLILYLTHLSFRKFYDLRAVSELKMFLQENAEDIVVHHHLPFIMIINGTTYPRLHITSGRTPNDDFEAELIVMNDSILLFPTKSLHSPYGSNATRVRLIKVRTDPKAMGKYREVITTEKVMRYEVNSLEPLLELEFTMRANGLLPIPNQYYKTNMKWYLTFDNFEDRDTILEAIRPYFTESAHKVTYKKFDRPSWEQ